MRVLLISHTCQSRTEGQPRAESLGAIPGVELCLLTPDRWFNYGKWRHPDLPVSPSYRMEVGRVALPWVRGAQYYLHYYPGLARLLKSFRPDVIDIWEEPWGLVSAQTCRLRNRLLPRTRIVTETEQNVDKHVPGPFEFFRSYTLRNADYAVGRSAEAIDVLRCKGYHGPAEVVGNGVDAGLFHRMDRDTCRRALGLDGYTVGYVGRLVEEKGLLDLVDALEYCPNSVKLLMVGAGPMQPVLEARAHALGRESQLSILPSRSLEELPEMMNSLDVLALPSRTTARWKEQFGRVIIEAHACGIPVIGTCSGAIPEVVDRGGWIVPERNPRALAAALVGCTASPGHGRDLGDLGSRQVETRYTWECIASRMHAIYRRLHGGVEDGSISSVMLPTHAVCRTSGGPEVATARAIDMESQVTPRHVLFVNHTSTLGGGELALFNLVTHLDPRYYKPAVILSSDGELNRLLSAAGIETHVLSLSSDVVQTRKDTLGARSLLKLGAIVHSLRYVRRLARFMRHAKADLVHTNSLKADVLGGFAARLAGVPVLWHVRDRIASDYLPAPIVRIFRWMCRWVPNYVIANSQATLETLALPKSVRSLTVYSGIMTGRSSVVHDGVETLLQTTDCQQAGPPQIGIVGRISPWKGQHVFIDAAAAVLKVVPNARFHIIGSAMFGEDDYEAGLRDRAEALGVRDSIEFTGFVTDIPSRIQRLTMLIHASTIAEPFGQVVIEGMAAAKPVIATRGGGITEIIEDGVTGVLVPMNDVPALSAAVLRLLSDPAAARAMGRAAYLSVQSRFGIDRTVERVESVYRELLGTGRGSRA